MGIRALDHVALTCADVEKTIEWYGRVLGATTHFEDLWRAGKIPVVILQVGGSRLSIHDAAAPASPRARVPTSGSGDICFRYDGPLDEARQMLIREGVEIIEGEGPRPAADGEIGYSVYFRDPDGNLLELLSTEESGD